MASTCPSAKWSHLAADPFLDVHLSLASLKIDQCFGGLPIFGLFRVTSILLCMSLDTSAGKFPIGVLLECNFNSLMILLIWWHNLIVLEVLSFLAISRIGLNTVDVTISSRWVIIPGEPAQGGVDHRSLSIVEGKLLLQITLTIWPPAAAKHLANFCPKFSSPWTIAYSNQREWNNASDPYKAFHAIGIRYYLS